MKRPDRDTKEHISFILTNIYIIQSYLLLLFWCALVISLFKFVAIYYLHYLVTYLVAQFDLYFEMGLQLINEIFLLFLGRVFE